MSVARSTLSQSGAKVLGETVKRSDIKREVRSVFSKYDVAGDGFIDESDLVAMLRDLNGKEPNKSEVLFALKDMDTSADGKISFDEFLAHWERVRAGHPGARFNKLLVRDKIGVARTSSYDLPPTSHSFGKPNAVQEVSAKDGE